MGVSVAPWDLAARGEVWGRWAIDYINAVREAPGMREQIDEARAKGQRAK